MYCLATFALCQENLVIVTQIMWATSQKYLLAEPLQKNFADPCARGKIYIELVMPFSFLLNVYLFERVHTHARARKEQRERRERVPSRLHAVSAEPVVGLDPTNHEIMT